MALRTNTKIVKDRIRQYIIDNVDVTNYGAKYSSFEKLKERGADFDVILNKAREIVGHTFYEEMCKNDNRYKAHRISHYDLFEDWVRGLPSILDCEFLYRGSAVKLLGDILEETEEERERFSETDAENKLIYLIYREVFR